MYVNANPLSLVKMQINRVPIAPLRPRNGLTSAYIHLILY